MYIKKQTPDGIQEIREATIKVFEHFAGNYGPGYKEFEENSITHYCDFWVAVDQRESVIATLLHKITNQKLYNYASSSDLFEWLQEIFKRRMVELGAPDEVYPSTIEGMTDKFLEYLDEFRVSSGNFYAPSSCFRLDPQNLQPLIFDSISLIPFTQFEKEVKEKNIREDFLKSFTQYFIELDRLIATDLLSNEEKNNSTTNITMFKISIPEIKYANHIGIAQNFAESFQSLITIALLYHMQSPLVYGEGIECLYDQKNKCPNPKEKCHVKPECRRLSRSSQTRVFEGVFGFSSQPPLEPDVALRIYGRELRSDFPSRKSMIIDDDIIAFFNKDEINNRINGILSHSHIKDSLSSRLFVALPLLARARYEKSGSYRVLYSIMALEALFNDYHRKKIIYNNLVTHYAHINNPLSTEDSREYTKKQLRKYANIRGKLVHEGIQEIDNKEAKLILDVAELVIGIFAFAPSFDLIESIKAQIEEVHKEELKTWRALASRRRRKEKKSQGKII